MTKIESGEIYNLYDNDPRMVASLSDSALKVIQDEVIVSVRAEVAKKGRETRMDDPMYDPRVEVSNKVMGDENSGKMMV